MHRILIGAAYVEASDQPAATGRLAGLSPEDKIRRILRPGDTITHTRCMGCLEEHIFTRYGEGKTSRWLCGKPTRDTVRLGGSKHEADDIAFGNVTHINRVPVGVCEFAAEFADRLREGAGATE